MNFKITERDLRYLREDLKRDFGHTSLMGFRSENVVITITLAGWNGGLLIGSRVCQIRPQLD